MNKRVLLSIVTPTRGNFSDYWLEQLLKIQGDIEFVLVYPPGVVTKSISDYRLKTIVSPYKGEVCQRFMGLLNASGEYVIALDDDDFIHPKVANLVTDYFQLFPESWVLRLRQARIDYRDQERLQQDWAEIPNINELKAVSRRQKEDKKKILLKLPIAPLTNKFDLRYLFTPYLQRKDMHGAHIENFNLKVWRNDLLQQTLSELGLAMHLLGEFNWIPFWSLDRLLGLFIQAKFFQENAIIGHWMPGPEQTRYVVQPQSIKREFRLIFLADALLAKHFPKYGYFWNLFGEQFWIALRKIASSLISLIGNRRAKAS